MKANIKRFIIFCTAVCFGVVNLCRPVIVHAKQVYGYGYYFRTEWIPKYTSYTFHLGSGYVNTAIPAIRSAIAAMNNNSRFSLTYNEAVKPAETEDGVCTIGSELDNYAILALCGTSNACMVTMCTRGSAGKIKETDIFVNNAFGWAHSTSTSVYDYQGAFTHELGHALGLLDMYHYAHNDYEDYVRFQKWFTTDESLPTMYGVATYKDSKKIVYPYLRTLESGDCNGLEYVYKLIVCG